MIKFIRSHIVIILSALIILISGFFILQTKQANAETVAIDYNTVTDMSSTPDKQIASYVYYAALLECINGGHFNHNVAGKDLNELFSGQSTEVTVGYIGESVAVNIAGASNDNNGVIQCETAAKAAFLLWGMNTSSNVANGFAGFGFKQKESYQCIRAITTTTNTVNATTTTTNTPYPSPDISFTLPAELKKLSDDVPVVNGLASDKNSDGYIDISELDSYCAQTAEPQSAVYAPKDAGTNDHNYSILANADKLYDSTQVNFLSQFKIYIKKSIFGLAVYDQITQEPIAGAPEPKISDIPGLEYYLNLYYFKATNICGAVNRGETSTLDANSSTRTLSTSEIENIHNGVSGPYVEVSIIDDVNGALKSYGFNMTNEKAKSDPEGKLPLWGNVTTTCSSVKESVGDMAKIISDDIKNSGNNNYLAIINASVNIDAAITDETYSNLVAGKPTCGSIVTGLGWIMCPVVNGLTDLNDGMWDFVSGLLTVNPLSQSTNIYAAWGVMRNLANIAFVIVFLVMIFSQLTSAGLSNYGIKKLLPRLIVGAILVNISFVILQVAVDLSNILGSSLNDIIIGVTPPAVASWKIFLNDFILGGVGVGGIALLAGSVFLGGASIFWMLLPTILIATLALFAAVFTLIFRQAAIPILAILAPLAIVAALLPNTESWFKKWKDEFIKMLALYPLAAIVFAGAQFASNLIIGDGNNFLNYFMGLIILALPLFSLPFLAKNSGKIVGAAAGALSKLAEKANSPIKNWAKSYQDEAKAKYLADESTHGKTAFGRRVSGWQRQSARSREGKRKSRELNTKTYGEQFNTQWAKSTDEKLGDGFNANQQALGSKSAAEEVQLGSQHAYSTSREGKNAIDRITKAKMTAHIDDSDAANRIEDSKDEAVLNLRMAAKAADATLKASQTETERMAKEASTEVVGAAPRVSAVNRLALQNAQRKFDIESSATNSATRIQQQEYEAVIAKTHQVTDAITGEVTTVASDEAIRAAGIDTQDGRGVTRLQAIAQSAADKRQNDEISARSILISGAPGTNKTNLIDRAGEALKAALANNDKVGARAATQILLKSGAPGKDKIHNTLLDVDPGPTGPEEALNGIRSDLLESNIKLSDNVLNTFAFTPGKTVRQLEQDPNILNKLTSEELATQNTSVLMEAFSHGGISKENATTLLNNPNATKNLSPEKRALFEKIRDGDMFPLPPSPENQPRADAAYRQAQEEAQTQAQAQAQQQNAQDVVQPPMPEDQTEYFGP